MEPAPGRAPRRHWWVAIAASVGFFVVGLAFLPGLVGREPIRETPSAAPSALPVEAEAEATSAAPDSASKSEVANVPSYASSPARLALDSFDCMISANETIEIGSSILAVIDSIEVERSDYVEAGQVLARLESSVEAAAVRVAEARAARTVEIESSEVSLRLGKKRRTRASDLYDGKTLSLDLREEVETEARLAELGVEQARENERLAQLQLAQARATLERRIIRSPVSGFVVDRLMAPGEVVDEEIILTIAEVDPLRVDVILPTQLFGSVARGDAVEIVPEEPLDEPRVATVAIVDRVLDAASGTFGVRVLLPNPQHDLPGGLRCQARLLPPGTKSPLAKDVEPGSETAEQSPAASVPSPSI